MDGFVEVMLEVALDIGIPKNCIYTKSSTLPGYFRPSKNWDFIIISPKNELIATVEFKSQVGSFGNNFNNRVEEAIGSAVDLWTAFRENGFPQIQQPWVGYMLLIEKSEKSVRQVKLNKPFFQARPEFLETGYLDRYAILCQKLMLERHYTSTALVWTNPNMEFGFPNAEISFENFLLSFMGFLQGKMNQFKK